MSLDGQRLGGTARQRIGPCHYEDVASAKARHALGARRFAADTLAEDAFRAGCSQIARLLCQAVRL